MKYTEQFKHSV